MAIIPLTFRLDWSDPSQPGGVMSTLNNNANTATSLATQYTMQDIIDTVAFDAGSVERTGTPIAGMNARWTSASTISGENVPESIAGDAEVHKGYRADLQWPTTNSQGGVWSTGFPMGNMDAWLTEGPNDISTFYVLDTVGRQPGVDVQPYDWTTVANRFSENIVMASNWLTQVMSNSSTFWRENVIIGTGDGLRWAAGYNCQENVWIGHGIFDSDLQVNTSSTVIIGANAFNDGVEASIQYGTYIGREIGGDYLVEDASQYNVHIGFRASSNKVIGGENVCIGSFTANAIDGLSTGNVMIGHNAGLSHEEGTNNTFIGYGSGPNATAASGGTNNTCIGNGAQITTAAADNEFVLGNASVTVLRCQQNVISALSDQRDKKDIVDLDKGLDTIMALQPRKFVWDPREIEVKKQDVIEKEDGTTEDVTTVEMVKPATDGMKDIGFIAQELQAVDDDYLRLVYAGNPDKLEAAYGRLVPVLVKAIQELSAKVTALENA